MTAVDAPAPEMAADDWTMPSLGAAEYRRRARHYRFRTVRRAAGFLSPYLIVWGVFLAIPVGWGIFLSFNQGGIVDDRKFVGFENWTRAWGDSELRTAVKNTSIYVVIAIGVVFALAIFLASLLNRYKRGSNFYKVALYFPLLAPPILGAMMWFFMTHFDFGVLNLIERGIFGGDGINFLGDNPNALLTIVAVEVWRGLGFWVLFYLAGLQSVPEELQAAARIDGAGKWRRFRRITVPTLRPLLLFALVIAVIFNFQLFDSVQVLTDGGPRLGTATVVWFIHKRLFKFQDTGLAYASSIGLLVVVLILTALSFWLLGKRRQREA
ncbi:MAG: sugar ABC transporter permease [bacterium]|nr:sugar ABC transporter permease [bacterium]